MNRTRKISAIISAQSIEKPTQYKPSLKVNFKLVI